MDIEDLVCGSFSGRTPQTDIAPGERVRSYDFAGNLECYADGVVEAITEPMEGCPRYRLRIERRVWKGQETNAHEGVVFPPVNGTPTLLGRLTNLVVRLTH
jgi:hypothetical protein